MTRSELAEQGGFIRYECRGCGRPFWSDSKAYCGRCQADGMDEMDAWDDETVEEDGDEMDAQDAGLRPKEEGVWDK